MHFGQDGQEKDNLTSRARARDQPIETGVLLSNFPQPIDRVEFVADRRMAAAVQTEHLHPEPLDRGVIFTVDMALAFDGWLCVVCRPRFESVQ
jgi:hypothetical protein